jgi:hypothetical protein
MRREGEGSDREGRSMRFFNAQMEVQIEKICLEKIAHGNTVKYKTHWRTSWIPFIASTETRRKGKKGEREKGIMNCR